MKKSIVMATLLASVSAIAGALLSSHRGTLALNGTHECSFTNSTDEALDVKWVVFNLERRFGKNPSVVAKNLVNEVVYPGESLTVDSGKNASLIGRSCKFLAR